MRGLLTALLLLIAAPALAQTNPVQVGRPFSVSFDHDGQSVTGFQCVLDGKPFGTPLSSASRSCAFSSGLSEGTHTIAVEAVNAFGRTSSAGLTATAGSPPAPPTNLQIQMTVAVKADGTVELVAFNVEKQ